MSDLRLNPEFKQCFVSYVQSDGQSITVWAQTDFKEVHKFETMKDFNFREMFSTFFGTNRQIINPLINKHYVFCDKSKQQFYRVLIKAVDSQLSRVLAFFIDFGYEESIPIDCLFVFDPLFIDCRPLARRYLLSDIRPKDPTKGFDSQKVVKSLEKFLRSVLMFAIFKDKKIKVYDNNREDVFHACFQNNGIDDIVFDRNETNSDLIAIDFDSESNRNSLTMTSDFKSAHSLTQFSEPISESLNETKTSLKNSENSSDLIDLNEIKEIPEPPEKSSTIMSALEDRTDKDSMIAFMKTLLGPKKLVYVTKTLSEKSIYVQLKDIYESVEELNQKMTVFYHMDKSSLRMEDMSVGMVIAAQFANDESWYRASVIDLKRKKSLVHVFYIDFGNTEIIEPKFCRTLIPEFRELARQAIPCRPLNNGLGADTLEMYEANLIELECEFIELSDKDMIDVILYDNGVLLSGSALSSPQKPENTIPIKEKEKSPEKTNVKRVSLKSIDQSKELFDETNDFLSSLVGMKKKVIISKAINSQSIYVQLEKNNFEIIDPLVEDMNDYYSTLKDLKPLSDSELLDCINFRTLIAVYYDLENKWLRAKVIALEEESVEVFYVDFGNQGKVEKSECRELADIYFGSPLQAIHCRPLNQNVKYYDLKKLESEEQPLSLSFVELIENVFQVLL